MVDDNMNISRLVVHSQHVKEARVKRKSRYAKRERSFDCGPSKVKIEIQDDPRFKNIISN